jgi:toxin ParE1/3/4
MTAGKKKNLRWFVSAVDDLLDIIDYIARDSPRQAERFGRVLKAKVRLLELFPYLGSQCPEHPQIRQLFHKKYIIYYSVHRTEVVIRAVVHGARESQFYWLRRRI